jgi:DNA polymerase III subunit alpha
LIVNSGGIDELEEQDIIDDNEEEEEDGEEEVVVKKKKVKAANYGRIAIALGQMISNNIQIAPPDINESSYTFSPDPKKNTILYGLRGINKVGNDLVNTVITFRPYEDIKDFLSKVKINKPQMVNLIKAGAFDQFGPDRVTIMREYINLISDAKKKLNLQNMQMLINFDFLPSDFAFDIQVYNFNKYLKKCKIGEHYGLDAIAQRFYEANFSLDHLFYQPGAVEYLSLIQQKIWDKIYSKQMDRVRNFIKENQEELLTKVNEKLTHDVWTKYCFGSLSKWEMDSVSFYSHAHELSAVRESAYHIVNFNHLPEEPDVDKVIFIKGREVPLFKLSRIAGTVLDKDKNKSTVTLLTQYGVVPVKIYQAQFVKYDKQISEKQANGHKKIIEKSWFSRGNKLMFTGIRRGDTFVPKIYKNGEFKTPIALIKEVDDSGFLITATERYSTDDYSSL